MSNFTKSVVYSTTVLAAGVVAIFAIYNNVSTSPDGSSVADITPAAGVSSIGIGYDKAIENVSNTIEASTEAAKEKVGEIKDSAEAAMEPVKSKMDDAGAVVGETIEQAGEAIEETFTPEDTIEQIEPAHEEIKKQIKGSSGPHALPEKSGALHMQRSPYLILAGSNSTPAPGGIDMGNIDDILDQATKDAQARAGKHSKSSKSYSKADKKRLLKGMKDSNFAERNNKKSKKKPMTQQAFIMQQALQAAQAKSQGQNPSLINKKAMQESLVKTVSLTTESQSKALITGNINALDFVQMAQDAANNSAQAAADTQAVADQAAVASAAAQQAANTAQNQADADAAAASASQQQAQQAAQDLAQAQADLAAAQQATIQAQTDLSNAQTAAAQAQAAETASQTNATNADAAATQAEADAAANPLDPALQQAAVDARAAADQAQLDYVAAQQTTANAQAAETTAANNEAAAQAAEANAANAEAAAVTAEANASAQATADAQVAAQAQAAADQLQTAANAAAQQAADTQDLANQLNQVIANNPTNTGTDLNNATQQAAGMSSDAQAAAAGLPGMESGQAGSMLEQAVTGAQTTVQQSSGNIVQAAQTAATNSVGNIQTIVQNATNPENAKAAARGFLTGQISGAMGGAGLGNLTQGLQASFAGAIGGDISAGVIISQVIQSVVSLPSEIIPIIPNIPFVGEVIGVLTQAATSLLTAAISGPLQEMLNFESAVTGMVGNASGQFGTQAAGQAATDLINAGGSPGGATNIVTQVITSVTQDSSQ